MTPGCARPDPVTAERRGRIEIVPARVADVDEIITVQRAAYRIEAARYGDVLLPPQSETRAELGAVLDTHTVLVARCRDQVPAAAIVGTARARVAGDTAYIGRLSVLPALHGQGIGRLLLEAIEQETAPERGYELFTGHRSERNLRMYERAGYRRVRTERQSAAVVLVHLEKVVVATGPPERPPAD